MIPNLSWIDRNLAYQAKKYNVDIIQLPHPHISAMLQTGSLSLPDRTMSKITFNDVYSHARAKTSMDWIISGMRISDSIFRLSMIKNSGTIDHKRKIIYLACLSADR
ncbi:MAG: hypothetical protein FWG64_02860 [Firmicutes bacterium]|nr:hypothetical protein [Bacillota bacterium]